MRARNQVRRRRRVPRKPRAKTTTALVRAVAKKVVADALEDKYASSTFGLGGGVPRYFNASVGGNFEVYRVLPLIYQGVNSNQRIGDVIRPKSLRVDFTITANGSYNSSQLNQVRLWVLQDKSIRDSHLLNDIPGVQVGTPIATQLLDLGGTTAGFNGYPDQIMARTNKQRYMVYHDKVYELCAGNGQTPQAGNGYNGNQVFVSSQQCWKISVRIPTPATLKYATPGSDQPSNFAPFFCLGYVQPDGNATPDNILTRVAVNWWSHFDYEDA